MHLIKHTKQFIWVSTCTNEKKPEHFIFIFQFDMNTATQASRHDYCLRCLSATECNIGFHRDRLVFGDRANIALCERLVFNRPIMLILK